MTSSKEAVGRSNGALWGAVQSEHAALDRDMSVDVAVVGGGITGVTVATLLKSSGQRVALLEARSLGSGVTGGTTAHVTEAVDTRYHQLEKDFGVDGARLVRESSRAAIEKIAALATEFGVADTFQRVPGFLFSEDPQGKDELRKELEAAQRAGAEVDLVDVPLPFSVGQGVRFRDQAQLSPLRYLNALARSIPGAGSAICEDTRVVKLEEGQPLRVVTAAGHVVRANTVILATHAPDVQSTFYTKVAQYRSYVVAAPLAGGIGGLFWDTADPYHYVRSAELDGTTYLIVGGEDHKTGKQPEGGPAAPFERLTRYAERFGVTPTRRWSAQVVEPADGLPFIGPAKGANRVLIASGFAGNGISFGTLAAMILHDLTLGYPNRYAELYRATRFKPLVSLAPMLKESVDFPANLLKSHLSASEAAFKDIPNGDGKIVRVGKARLAVYRDDRGELHALSARCTHMGCEVAFNRAEMSWDCPCHGSRFATDGCVLDGPATQPLEAHRLSVDAVAAGAPPPPKAAPA